MPRPKFSFRTGSKERFSIFCKENPQIKITYMEFLNALKVYNKILINHILETGDKLKLPYGLGELTITKYKRKRFITTKEGIEKIRLKPDWNETKKLWRECSECKDKKQLVYHLNQHSDGYSYYWMWLSGKSKLRSSFIWTFELYRIHSRKLVSLIKKPNSKYKNLYMEYKIKRFIKNV